MRIDPNGNLSVGGVFLWIGIVLIAGVIFIILCFAIGSFVARSKARIDALEEAQKELEEMKKNKPTPKGNGEHTNNNHNKKTCGLCKATTLKEVR